MRTFMKRLRKQLAAGDVAAATETMPKALTAIGKAAVKGVIHRNTASRYVSRLTRAMNRASAPAEQAAPQS
jgi:small subunit ribosomal protein S20